jgi:beta-glucosidase
MVSSFDFRTSSGLSTFDYIYEPGLTYSRDKNTDFSKVIAKAKQADVILYFCGEEAILSGEARCRADLNLPGAQRELMKALAATGKPVVMVVMAGRPLTIGAEVEQAAAVLYAFHGGTMAGQALCNIITGKTVPSGKTPITFPKMVGQVPLYYNRLNTGRPSYDPPMLIDSIPIGCPQFSIGQSSYWLETPTEPLFPFGFGLSYTTFEYGPTTYEKQASGAYEVTCLIKNTGKFNAFETAQLYAHQLSGTVARPIAELKGFKKVFIPAGDSCTVTFTITPEQLGYWHDTWEPVRGSDVKAHRYYFATDNAPFTFRIAPHS